ncbi:hypothetical protein JW949_03770 [Candidatus Woesearchaeota archaeon]|nr:hypothetical protein [Candidatus Woesearchaeota archaeon]
MTNVLIDLPKDKQKKLDGIIEDIIKNNGKKEKLRKEINILIAGFCIGDYLVDIINSEYSENELKKIGFEKQSLFEENKKEFLGYRTIRGTLLFRKIEKDNGKYSKYCIK